MSWRDAIASEQPPGDDHRNSAHPGRGAPPADGAARRVVAGAPPEAPPRTPAGRPMVRRLPDSVRDAVGDLAFGLTLLAHTRRTDVARLHPRPARSAQVRISLDQESLALHDRLVRELGAPSQTIIIAALHHAQQSPMSRAYHGGETAAPDTTTHGRPPAPPSTGGADPGPSAPDESADDQDQDPAERSAGGLEAPAAPHPAAAEPSAPKSDAPLPARVGDPALHPDRSDVVSPAAATLAFMRADGDALVAHCASIRGRLAEHDHADAALDDDERDLLQLALTLAEATL